jgi:tripartite-type tricarboxylate transporter receptor subunit TctC
MVRQALSRQRPAARGDSGENRRFLRSLRDCGRVRNRRPAPAVATAFGSGGARYNNIQKHKTMPGEPIMKMLWRSLVAAILAALPLAAHAQTPAEFYRGKTVELNIGYSVGGGYDIYARLIARHMGKHIPGNPKVVPRNMEGAGGMRLANWLYTAAPRDGTVFGATSRAMAFEPLLGNKSAQYDASKITWIGSANDEVSVCMAWHTTDIVKFEDVQQRQLVVGAGGVSDDTYQFPAILNNMFGAKFKMVTGYAGGTEINIAMERNEVLGRCGFPWSTVKATYQHWIREKRFNLLMQFSLAKHADLPDVPLVMDLAKTDEHKQILTLIFGRQVMGRPYAAPPGVPKDRAEALRQAFMATMEDKAFLAEVDKAQFEIIAVSGQKLEDMVMGIYRTTPPAVAAKAAAMVK